MRRGEVYWAELAPRSGSEQTGRRPVVIVSEDGFNQSLAWMSIIVVPVSTSAKQAGRGPTVVPAPRGSAGLPRQSFLLCHQVTTLDRSKISQRIGALPFEILRDLDLALKAAMDLD